MNVLEFEAVVRKFGHTIAVDDVSFTVGEGEIISLLGPSGCGKTTSLRLIAGFEKPDTGKLLISGRDVIGQRPYERNVGLLFQDYALFPHMTVEQNIAYGLKYRGFEKARIVARIAEMLRLVKLQGYEKRRPDELSGGQQQRVALARALAPGPELMLLDEPLSSLDAKLRDELRVELKSILASVGSTTVLVTHDQQEAMSLSDRIILMKNGKVIQEGPPASLYDRPANRFVADFFSRPNWFSGQLTQAPGSDHAWVAAEDAPRLAVPRAALLHDGNVDVCVRRERIGLSHSEGSSDSPPVDGTNRLEGQVLDVFQFGPDIETHVALQSGRTIVAIEKSAGQRLWQTGERVAISFLADDCIVLPQQP